MRPLVEDPAHGRPGQRISRCVPSRRDRFTRMEGAGGCPLSRHLRLGILTAAIVLALDQASKYWLLEVFGIGNRGAVRLAPFFDLVLAWNQGISFGWFQSEGATAQTVLMAIKAVAVVVLSVWMARSRTLLATLPWARSSAGPLGTQSIALPMARWWILPCFTSKSAERPSVGTCLT